MNFWEAIAVGTIPVVIGWFGTLFWLILSDHWKNKIHDERHNALVKEVAALKSMCELNNKIIIARGWAKVGE